MNKQVYFAIILSLLSFTTIQGQIQDDPILKAIKSEVDRNKAGLHVGNLDYPFWISYRFLNATQTTVYASAGALQFKEKREKNIGIADLLVGNDVFNNNNDTYQSYHQQNKYPIGKTDIESALKYVIWSQLDPDYKKSAESFEGKKVKVAQQNIPEEEKNIHDWDQSTPIQYYCKKESKSTDQKFWSDYCRKASIALGKNESIISSDFQATITEGDYYYYSTDGFMYRLPMCFIDLSGTVECRSDDGQIMNEKYSFYFDDINDVTPIDTLCSEIIKYNGLLIEESKAPMISDSYSGPVLYEGTAVSNAVNKNFLNASNGLLAKRKGLSNSENRMEQMIDKKVADRRLNFISMTGTPRWHGQKLLGYTPIDAQGVRPDSSLTLINHGVLKNMLSDRTPTKTNPKSNGHSRINTTFYFESLGAGNIRLTASQTIPGNIMKDSLLAAAKEEGYDFAYIYRGYPHMGGCFLYKVYQDGREEMVRNGSISDMNQKQFKYILHIGTEDAIHNINNMGFITTLIVPCGIIFKELEIVRNNNMTLEKPFIVPRPLKTKK